MRPPAVVAAARLTAEGARRLGAARSGRVHSAFAGTVNVELAGLGDQGWISFHGPGPIPSPFGVACAALPALHEAAGAPVRVEGDLVRVAGGLEVRLAGARRVDTALPSAAPSPDVPLALAHALATVRGGLLPVAAALLSRTAPPEDALARLAGPALARLLAATAAADAPACVEAARPLVGLGPGLTPSGDDCLLGWLAGARCASPAARRLADLTGPGLLAAGAERTGRLSRAFLAAALAGAVAEPVLRFVTRPDPEGVAALLALGATSGSDFLAGYLLARTALAGAA